MNRRGLREVLNDEDYWARRFALRDAFKTRSVDVLVAGLTDPDHRIIAAHYLGKLRAAESRAQLERLLRASDRAVRASAAKALGLIGTAEVVPSLVDAVNDPARNVQTTAVVALGESRRIEAIQPLIAIARSDDRELARLALKALRKVKNRAALAELRDVAREVPVTRRAGYWLAIAILKLRGT